MADAISGFLNPSSQISGNELFSKNPITGNKLFSDNISKIASENQISTKIGQAGVFNLQGNIDASSKKSALLYAPVTNTNSPNSRVSSSPQVNQAGSDSGLGSLFSGGNTLLLVGGGLLLAYLLTSGKSSNSSRGSYSLRTEAPRVKTGNISVIPV